MNYYLLLKTLHISTVVFSISLLLFRTILLLRSSELLNTRILKVTPHLNDSLLLISALTMLFTSDYISSGNMGWVYAKITAMLLYILTGIYLFRRAKNKHQILYLLSLALILYLYIIQTAITKNFIPFIFV